MRRAISGLDNTQRRRATGFTAPPSPFTKALFCPWAWSVAIPENTCAVFFTKYSFAKLCKDARMIAVQRNHVMQMNRYSSGIIGVAQCEEPWNDLGQCVYVEQEVSLPYRSHVQRPLQFQLQDIGPKQEETSTL